MCRIRFIDTKTNGLSDAIVVRDVKTYAQARAAFAVSRRLKPSSERIGIVHDAGPPAFLGPIALVRTARYLEVPSRVGAPAIHPLTQGVRFYCARTRAFGARYFFQNEAEFRIALEEACKAAKARPAEMGFVVDGTEPKWLGAWRNDRYELVPTPALRAAREQD